MRTIQLSGLVAIALCLLVPLSAVGRDEGLDGRDEPVGVFDWDPAYFLYVISAEAAEIDGDVLTLVDAPSILYFSDRPHRVTGHMDPELWLEGWDSGPNSFADIPPNAVLVAGASPMHEFVVELLDMSVDGEDLRFRFESLDGEVPTETLEPASLFIDSAELGPTIKGWLYQYLDPMMVSTVGRVLEDHGVDLQWTSDEFPCELWSREQLQQDVHSVMMDYFPALGRFLGVAERCGAGA